MNLGDRSLKYQDCDHENKQSPLWKSATLQNQGICQPIGNGLLSAGRLVAWRMATYLILPMGRGPKETLFWVPASANGPPPTAHSAVAVLLLERNLSPSCWKHCCVRSIPWTGMRRTVRLFGLHRIATWTHDLFGRIWARCTGQNSHGEIAISWKPRKRNTPRKSERSWFQTRSSRHILQAKPREAKTSHAKFNLGQQASLSLRKLC